VAFGTDTGGSVRIPSACCGTAGLKTTYGRIDTAGVWPLAASLDTVGPMARDIAGLVAGMQLLEPGFTADVAPATRIGRVRVAGVDPVVDTAVDDALARAGFEVTDVEDPGWVAQWGPGFRIMVAEAWQADGHLLAHRDLVSPDIATLLDLGRGLPADDLAGAYEEMGAWRARLLDLLASFDVLALPAMPVLPVRLTESADALASHMIAANLAGVPALAQPIPSAARLPASLQLVAPHDGEALLLATGQLVEDRVARTD
jgi:amidase